MGSGRRGFGGEARLERLHLLVALLLVKEQARMRVESLWLGLLIGVEHGAQGFQYEGTSSGKASGTSTNLRSMGNTGSGLGGVTPGALRARASEILTGRRDHTPLGGGRQRDG
ncbi:hypothetical protein [uncultured Thiodictyon sp.]|uniref:hypothetical protein n=1 Tax=uncultured Thiodictyon sp. TaxID=1846217 RepID=UPI0025CC3A46|nr:hypothetical protein [uncultured Thiodictyon sp.]